MRPANQGRDSDLVATQEEYGQLAFAIANSADEVAPDASADDTEWLSLGVFALTQDGRG